MKRLYCLFLILAGFVSSAQTGKISINVLVPEDAVPAEAHSMLLTKLNQIVTNYDLADNGYTDRFFLTADVLVTSKDIVPKVSQKLEVVLFIGDVIENKLYGSMSMPIVGVGQNDNKSYINAFQKIPTRSKALEAFMEETKDKIVSFYHQNGNSIIKSAEALAKSGQYDEAIQTLLSIPDFCGEVSENAGEAAQRVYQMKIDKEGAALYNKAKAIWESNPEESTVGEILDLLNEVNPESSVAADCSKLISRMTSTLASRKAKRQQEAEVQRAKAEEKERAEWEFKMRQYEDQIELQRQQLKDQTSIEKARVETEKSVSGHIGKIDFNKVTRIVKSWTNSRK